MSKTFPKPWRLEQVDPGPVFAVIDAQDRKLFLITGDDNPDSEEPAGDLEGATILGSGTDDENDELLDALEEMFR